MDTKILSSAVNFKPLFRHSLHLNSLIFVIVWHLRNNFEETCFWDLIMLQATIGVLKTFSEILREAECWRLFSIKLQILQKFYSSRDCKTDIFQWIFQNFEELLFYSTRPGDCFWYLESLTFKLLILNKFVHSIKIFSKQYLINRNVDFVFYYPCNLKNILV